ncbi:histidine kinase [Burkholderia pseudomallei]|uniref:histidine kinase n=1 Tax=Burkholderia pseudomallei TaxID=28450 RepID=UPI00050DF753|nr:histidine kinase [Burkholderia pseudomallei]KGD54422.1 his Kinase A domain protein [Burkholderia pseudomallei]
MHGTFNLPLVALSLAIATLASYTALDLSALITLLDQPRMRRAWLAGGAAAMGTGIWAMHFVGMLAFSLPIPLGYDFGHTFASLAIAVVVSYFALNAVTRAAVTRAALTRERLAIGGVLMGLGIAGMHYTGMSALRMQPAIAYDFTLFVASIAIAIGASTTALWIAHRLSNENEPRVLMKRIAAAGVMGLAITGMHYTGMAAAHFGANAVCGAAGEISGAWLGATIALFTVTILSATLVVSRFDARTAFLRGMTDALEELVAKRTSELEGALRQYERTTHVLQRTRRKMEQEIDERKAAQARLEHEKDEQRRLIRRLEETHVQLLQSEKLASIGQLAAGVAHEINNPIGFVNANLNTLRSWVQGLLDVIAVQEALTGTLAADARAPLAAVARDIDLDYVRGDILALIDESIDGAMRVRRIVCDLRDFSRPSGDAWAFADLHASLESTLNVVHNELKYKADIVREYGVLPLVECNAAQLSQVFMNLLVNAAQSIGTHGTITIRTTHDGDTVSISIADTGAGIPEDAIGRIFDPFFTTKPVGQGTGLGLSISHGIVEHHGGRIDVESHVGRGSTLTVTLPVRRKPEPAARTTAGDGANNANNVNDVHATNGASAARDAARAIERAAASAAPLTRGAAC